MKDVIYLDCIRGSETHKADCPELLARVCSVGIECEHGYDVCPQCDPCTCPRRRREVPNAADE